LLASLLSNSTYSAHAITCEIKRDLDLGAYKNN